MQLDKHLRNIMITNQFLLPCIIILTTIVLPTFGHYKNTVKINNNAVRQLKSVEDLINRVLGAQSAQRFLVIVQPDNFLPRHNAEIINVASNNVSITGNSGVAVAWALHIYLTQYAKCHFSWSGNQIASLPDDHLPAVPGGRLSLVSQDDFTAYPNVCTFGYSFLWWNFTDWEKEIDWMALHGINLPYALNAQEYMFSELYTSLGVSNAGLNDFFTGPAFLPWNRMGNVKGWGGPLTKSYQLSQMQLQLQIVKRMNDLGMYPVLPGFSGIVPDEIIKIYPHVKYQRLSSWGGFGTANSSMVLLDPTEPLFNNISRLAIRLTEKTYGEDNAHFYAMDSFNEVRPESGDLNYLANVSTAIFRGMVQEDPNGIWVSMSWFLHDTNFWTADKAKAYLDPIPRSQLILADLDAEAQRYFEKFNGYFGHSFIWQTLINFGGNNNMFGGLKQIVNPGPFAARHKYPNLIGTGIAPEGRGNNDVLFELALELNWRTESVDTAQWVQDYSVRRYGSDNSEMQYAWQQLEKSIHNEVSDSSADWPLLTQRPSLGLSENVYYNALTVEDAWNYFLNAASDNVLKNSQLFRHDLVDLTRQMIQIRFVQFYYDLTLKIKANATVQEVITSTTTLLSLLETMDNLLAKDDIFLLQRAISKIVYNSSTDATLLEFNLRNQLTCWGPGPDNIQDYAGKMWNGLIKDYYLPRWVLFFEQLITSIVERQPMDMGKFKQDVFTFVEKPFYESTTPTGPATATGDPIKTALDIARTLPRPPTNDVISMFDIL